MYKHILIATDGSELAQRAVTRGLTLAKALGAKVTAITVTDMFPTGPYSSIPTPSMIERYDEAEAGAQPTSCLRSAMRPRNLVSPARRCTSTNRRPR
jgi:nucleotide-binding universal stress UspA family protein